MILKSNKTLFKKEYSKLDMKAGKAERLKTNQMQKKVFSEDNLHPIKRLEERKLMQKRRKESFLCACVCACV
jgi:hypothetical protein